MGYLSASIGRIHGPSQGSSEIIVTAMLMDVITVQITAVLITRFITAREGRLAVAMWEKAIATGTDCYAVVRPCFRRRLPARLLC